MPKINRITSVKDKIKMKGSSKFWGHAGMFTACAIWGLMAPIGKDAMQSGITGVDMVTFRATGGAICFWIASLFVKEEHVPSKDMMLFFFAGLLSIVFNQCCFTIGLSLTSPVNASIVTTTMPIVALITAAIFLKEPITGKKVTGIFCGAIGALILITGSASATSARSGHLAGDLLCFVAQCSFATYLALFKHLISKYNTITCMKWMFTYAAIVIIPFSYHEVSALDFASIAPRTWAETAFVVIGATFFAYILMMHAQKSLRPTVVAMYNYVQPIVACIVSVAVGLGTFGWSQALAVMLICLGVYAVNKSKSRADLEAEGRTEI